MVMISWWVELRRVSLLVPWSFFPWLSLGGPQGHCQHHDNDQHRDHLIVINTINMIIMINMIIVMTTPMKVFSGPPNVVFTWRHWGQLEGAFQDHQVHYHRGHLYFVHLHRGHVHRGHVHRHRHHPHYLTFVSNITCGRAMVKRLRCLDWPGKAEIFWLFVLLPFHLWENFISYRENSQILSLQSNYCQISSGWEWLRT